MALIDRLFHDDPDTSRHIANHRWSAALWFFARGELTRANVVNAFGLTVDDQVQLDELIAHYQGLTATEQAKFHNDVEAAGVLAENGDLTKAKYRQFLGMTP